MVKLSRFFITTIVISSALHCSSPSLQKNDLLASKHVASFEPKSYLNRINEIIGRPLVKNSEELDDAYKVSIDHGYYLGDIDCKIKAARWISHIVAPIDQEEDDQYERKFSFTPDPTLPKYCQTLSYEYTNSGYDRGHLAAAKDFAAYGREAIKVSFYTSNILPQVGSGFNRDLWKNLEEYIRQLSNKIGPVLVYTGPIFADYTSENFPTINHDIPVPTAYYKIVVHINDEEKMETIGFVIENTDHRKQNYGDSKLNKNCEDLVKNEANLKGDVCPKDNLVNIERHIMPIDKLEKIAKIRFFNNVATNESIKITERNSSSW